MINKISNNLYNYSFCGKTNYNAADKFIADTNKIATQEKQGNFWTKNIWSDTALIAAALPVLGYELITLLKIKKLQKANKILAAENLSDTFKKISPFVILGGIAIYEGLQYLFSRNTDKKYEDIKKMFKDINTSTNAKLVDKPIYSSLKGAYFNPMSGEVSINRIFINDPILERKCKKLLKHELVHARQFETIARMDDGIEKLNYACMKRIANNMGKNPFIKSELIDIYNEIISNPNKYENTEFILDGIKINLKKYITAVYTILINKNANYKDIPMIINEDYYKEVRNSKGKLTQDEQKMAEKYYQAQIDYPVMTIFQSLNPFSAYRNNLLEVEAYRENPGIYSYIRKLFNNKKS